MSANINDRAEKMLDSLKQFDESFKTALIEEYGKEAAENIVKRGRYADALNTLVSYVGTYDYFKNKISTNQ